jgi:predicted transcriptional regulator
MKDKEIAKELGMKLGSVSTIIGQLFELGIIDKDVDSVQIQKGSKNKKLYNRLNRNSRKRWSKNCSKKRDKRCLKLIQTGRRVQGGGAKKKEVKYKKYFTTISFYIPCLIQL